MQLLTSSLLLTSKLSRLQLTHVNLTLSDNNVVGTSSSTATLTIDATAQVTTNASTIDASAEDDGKIVINTGSGADGSVSANYGDTITTLAGADTISGAGGIDAGAGTDSITGGG